MEMHGSYLTLVVKGLISRERPRCVVSIKGSRTTLETFCHQRTNKTTIILLKW